MLIQQELTPYQIQQILNLANKINPTHIDEFNNFVSDDISYFRNYYDSQLDQYKTKNISFDKLLDRYIDNISTHFGFTQHINSEA
jgi:hypothetical protein